MGEAIIRFENGVTCYALQTSQVSSYQAACENGSITILRDGAEFDFRVPGPPDYRGMPTVVTRDFPKVQPVSTVIKIVEDLVHALDTGESTRGGIYVARASLELAFAVIESHVRGGARVDLPLERRNLILNRSRAPREPMYHP